MGHRHHPLRDPLGEAPFRGGDHPQPRLQDRPRAPPRHLRDRRAGAPARGRAADAREEPFRAVRGHGGDGASAAQRDRGHPPCGAAPRPRGAPARLRAELRGSAPAARGQRPDRCAPGGAKGPGPRPHPDGHPGPGHHHRGAAPQRGHGATAGPAPSRPGPAGADAPGGGTSAHPHVHLHDRFHAHAHVGSGQPGHRHPDQPAHPRRLGLPRARHLRGTAGHAVRVPLSSEGQVPPGRGPQRRCDPVVGPLLPGRGQHPAHHAPRADGSRRARPLPRLLPRRQAPCLRPRGRERPPLGHGARPRGAGEAAPRRGRGHARLLPRRHDTRHRLRGLQPAAVGRSGRLRGRGAPRAAPPARERHRRGLRGRGRLAHHRPLEPRAAPARRAHGPAPRQPARTGGPGQPDPPLPGRPAHRGRQPGPLDPAVRPGQPGAGDGGERATGSRSRPSASWRTGRTSRPSPRRTRSSSGTSKRARQSPPCPGQPTESFVGLALFGAEDHIAVALGDGRIRLWGPAS